MSGIANIVARCANEPHHKNIYTLISDKISRMQYTADGVPCSPISHTTDELHTIKNELFSAVQDGYVSAYGTNYRTLADVESTAKAYTDAALRQVVKDGFYNPLNGTGTAIDPSTASAVSIPLLVGPEEVTALYANGGICQIVIDKKSKGVLLNGYRFKSDKFTEQELVDLHGYADSTGFLTAMANALRDANIYGGSALFPVFAGENPLTTAMSLRQLFDSKLLRKNCITRWISVDRWNTVVVPNYDLCAEDYLRPRSFYVPISGLEVNSVRAALLKPKAQPYWSAIQQLGWGEPDSVGYISAIKGYEIMMMSIPIMWQQMSLLVHQLPLDGIIAQNGPEAARKWQKENEKQLRDWSMFNPKAINSYGEIAVINRTYSGLDGLVDAQRKDVSAKAGIPESVIFFSQPNGIFNRSEEDVLLKQSETIKMIQRAVIPSLNKLLPFIAVSLWGLPEGDVSWQKYQTLSLDLDSPVISSPSQKADIAQKYSQAISTLCGAGMPLGDAVSFIAKLASDVELPSDFSLMQKPLPESKIDQSVMGEQGEASVQEGASAVGA